MLPGSGLAHVNHVVEWTIAPKRASRSSSEARSFDGMSNARSVRHSPYPHCRHAVEGDPGNVGRAGCRIAVEMHIHTVRDKAFGQEDRVPFEAARPTEMRMNERDAHGQETLHGRAAGQVAPRRTYRRRRHVPRRRRRMWAVHRPIDPVAVHRPDRKTPRPRAGPLRHLLAAGAGWAVEGAEVHPLELVAELRQVSPVALSAIRVRKGRASRAGRGRGSGLPLRW